MRIVGVAVLVVVVLAMAPVRALARAEGGSETDDALDTVTNHIKLDGPGSGSASTGPRAGRPGSGGRGRYTHVSQIVENAGHGCPDGAIERVWRVDRSTGQRTLVYGGCIRPRTPGTPGGPGSNVTPLPPSAAMVRETLPVETGEIRSDPAVTGLTGMETRFAYEGPATFGPFTTTLNGYIVTANLRVTDYVWETGDGATYHGPTANHTYGRTGDYTVTLTLTWQGGYTFSGPNGALGTGTLSLTTVANRTYQVDQIQAVGTG